MTIATTSAADPRPLLLDVSNTTLTVKLRLLIDPKSQQVEIYRSGQHSEILEAPGSIDCSEVMPGFVMSTERIFSITKAL